MKNNTPQLTDSDVLKLSRQRLAQHLSLKADGYLCSSNQLFDILLAVAASCDTVESVCSHLRCCPCAATIRGYFNQQLRVEDLSKLQTAINQALAQALAELDLLRKQEVAIDYHDQPFYGKSQQQEGLWVRAEAKRGTTRVYRVATAYIIVRGLRFTLAIKFVGPEDNNKRVVSFLLKRLKRLKIKASLLYLDRGFAGIELIKYLRRIEQSAVMACPIRGKQGGVKVLCVGRGSYQSEHIFASRKHGKVKTKVAICRMFTTAKRKGHKQKKAEWMVFILINVEMKVEQVRKRYRRRFGIESSYRCSRKVRGWTSSNNVAYRFLLIGLSFILMNVWIELRYKWARRPRRGGRRLEEAHFRLRRLAKFILQAVEAIYGRVSHIESLSQANAYG